ncbi:MAG: hypothetical protein J6I58_04905 [Eubacterium sp.]|nr:hypothetical protein [Eubacterium sp.]
MYDKYNGFSAEEEFFLHTMNEPVRLSRVGLIRELMRIKDDPELDRDIAFVVKDSIRLLSMMTDEEYDNYEFDDLSSPSEYAPEGW